MNEQILAPEVQHYLQQHETAAPTSLALRKSPFLHVYPAELAQQLDGRQRCRKKLPLWYSTPNIYYPEKLSVEQASSQHTAAYKSSLIAEQSRIIDLTGGFGVDAYYFAQRAKTVAYCERNESLARIAQYNARILGADNIDFIAANGLMHLQSQADDTFDYSYIDPSRRIDKRKVFLLEDCEPNVVALQDWLLQKTKKSLIKSAPLLDISSALSVLKRVCEVHIISVDNECKELLFVLDREYMDAPQIIVAALKGGMAQRFQFYVDEEKSATTDFGHPEGYLYEPDAALLKSGAFKLIGQRYGLKKLHQHTHLYTSVEANPDFMGRTFRIDSMMLYSDFKKNKATTQANVSTRNFPLKSEELRKRHRIDEGGNRYLFFCTGMADTLLVIFTSKC
ncbi:class I SAM-dependent methyltransferase [Parapedobacter tibetensis]|uniref:class I SAM-dependent methyltransferase n=1 Tax=Parapedobacter tibetensis TaxID=2972951 RepID=UPI00214D6EBD|nr:class I SAM-dependent methyltransferase [Parapedobacter tibetensis]